MNCYPKRLNCDITGDHELSSIKRSLELTRGTTECFNIVVGTHVKQTVARSLLRHAIYVQKI